MAQTIKLKRSSVAGNVPGSSDLALGEIAVNTADGAVYIKKGNNDIVAVADNNILHIDSDTSNSGANKKIGIGTTSPAFKLSVDSGTTDWPAFFKSTDNKAGIIIADDDTTAYFGTENSKAFMGLQAGIHANNLNIDSSGNVGIGTTSPGEKLDIVSAGSVNMRLNNTGNSVSLSIGAQSSAARITAGSGNRLGLGAGNTQDILTIASGGNVGIGTDSPGYKLDVSGSINATYSATNANVIGMHNSTSGEGWIRPFSNGGDFEFNVKYPGGDSDYIFYVNDSTELMRIKESGNVGIGTTSPDDKLHIHASSGDGIIKITGDGSETNGGRIKGFNGGLGIETTDGAGNYPERMRINSSGNVGIGETAPQNLLHVKASDTGIAPHASAQIVLEREGTNYLQFLTAETGTSGVLFGDGSDVDVSKITVDHNTTKMTFTNETVDTMTLNGDKVGIGTASPIAKLHVAGTQYLDGDLDIKSPGVGNSITVLQSTSGNAIVNIGESAVGHGFLSLYEVSVGDVIKFDANANSFINRGNFGIGTSSPSSKLTVEGDIKQTSGDLLYSGGGNWDIAHQGASQNIVFKTTPSGGSATEVMRIRHDGNVGIGTSSPSANLAIVDGGSLTNTDGNNRLMIDTSGHSYIMLNSPDGYDQGIHFRNNTDGTMVGRIAYTHRSGGDSLLFRVAGSDRLGINSSGAVTFNSAYTFPTADGSANQVLQTDGSGNLSFGTAAGGGVSISNNADNRVLTGDGTNANAEANLLFNGSTLTITGTTVSTGQITTGYGLSLTGGNTNFLLYNNTNDNLLYMRDQSNGQMLTTWYTNKFYVNKILDVNGDIQKGGTVIVDSSRNLTNIGTISSGAITSSGRIKTTNGLFQASNTDVKLRQYYLSTGDAGGSFLLGKIENSANADGGVEGIVRFAHDYGSSTNNCAIHFHFAQRSGTARGTWWYEHDDQEAAADRVHVRLIDDGAGNMYVWATCVDYAKTYIETTWRQCTSVSDSGTLTAGTLTTGTTLFDTANDPTSEHHIGKLYAHDQVTVSQSADSSGIRINGHDDRSDCFAEMYINSAGNAVIRQENADASGYLQIQAENYLELSGPSLVYTGSNFRIYDTGRLQIGASNDLEVYHDGTDNQIRNINGDLYIKNEANDKDIIFQSDNGSGGAIEYLRLDGGLVQTVASKHILFNDNVQARFGDAADLQILHDASDSFLINNTGDLYIRNNTDDKDILIQTDNGSGSVATYAMADGSLGSFKLFHYGSKKLETKSDGVDITGELQADSLDIDGNGDISGNLTVGGDLNVGTADLIKEENSQLKIQSGQGVIINIDNNDAGPDIFSVTKGSSGSTILQISTSGNSSTFSGPVEATSFSDGTISGVTFIDEDSFSTNSATRVPTQQSIKAYVDAQVAGVVDTAPAALNTLNELAAALGDDASFSTTTSTALGNRLRVDTASQGLTGTQQANAITNLGITATKAELNYVDGVTSNIQTQLDGKLTGNQTITLSGDVSGSGTTSIAVTIADDSHNHVISNVDGLQTALDAKAALSGATFTGNIIAEDSEIHVGDTSGDTWTRIKHVQADDYGFDFEHNNASVIVNEQGTTNQALVLGDSDNNTSYVAFGISHKQGAGSWTKKLELQGDGDLFIGTGATNQVFHDGYHPNADTLTTARTIAGTSFDGSANIDINYNNLTNKPTIPTNNNQLTNGAGYITSSNSAITNKLPLAGGTMSGSIAMANNNITGLNQLEFNDPGEGIVFKAGSSGDMVLKIIDDASDNILQYSGTSAVFDVVGNITTDGLTSSGSVYVGSATTNGGVINLIQSSSNPEIRIQGGEGGASLFSIYNTATNPDAEQFFINNTLSSSHLGNKRGALKLESSSGVVLTLGGTTATFAGNVDVGSGIDVTGNITVTGTVDGRDVATDGTKLDGIEANATADQTASEILTAIKTVDGASSGLDADLLDGQHGSYYRNAGNINAGTINTARLPNPLTLSGGVAILKLQETDVTNSPTWWHVADGGNYSIRLNNTGTYPFQIVSNGTNNAVSNIVLGYNTDFSAGIDVTGNITVTGTVDGRDVATDGSKLDGIESGATADQTASEILTAIKTVDGASSGLDADLLDGQHGSYYRSATNINAGTLSTARLADTVPFGANGGNGTENTFTTDGGQGVDNVTHSTFFRDNNQTFGALGVSVTHPTNSAYTLQIASTSYSNANTLKARVQNNGTWTTPVTLWSSGNDGANSGLDADVLDGQHGSYYLNYNNFTNTPTIPTNNNQLTNGAGYTTNTGTVSSLSDLSITATAAEINKLDGYTGSVTELNYLDTLHATGVTSTEFDYLDGVTSNIQTQLGTKANLTGATFTGDLTIPNKIIHSGDTDTYLSFATADDFRIVVGNSTRAAFNTSKIHFNQEGIGQDFQVEGNTDTSLLYVDASADNVGIGTATPAHKLEVNGSFAATTKSFDIEHPSKEGMRLKHGVVEGPEHSVYVRGKSKEKVISLPEYWPDLIHEDSITVQLTAIGGGQNLYVEDIKDNKVYVNGENYFYYIQAERKDVERFEVEYEV